MLVAVVPADPSLMGIGIVTFVVFFDIFRTHDNHHDGWCVYPWQLRYLVNTCNTLTISYDC